MAKKSVTLFLLFLPIVLIFRNWFLLPFLSARDWPYFFRETLSDYPLFLPAWAPTSGIGLGGEIINPGLGGFIYSIVSILVNSIGLPWELVYRVLIFGLFLVLSVFSSIYLLRSVLKRPTILQYLLSVLVYTANTYILMVVDGGQMGVALAYSLSPLVLAMFIDLVGTCGRAVNTIKFQISNFKLSIIAGLVLAVQIMFDVRIAFLTAVTIILYTIYHYIFVQRFNLKLCAVRLLFVALIVLGLHAYWILPIVVFRSHPVQEALGNFGSIESFRFFSFATFSQSLSLLHPNWPENIFGKVYFMRPEFLGLPILAFLSLLFLNKKNGYMATRLHGHKSNMTIQPSNHPTIMPFFTLLALLGAFLAKGANPPFSEVNTWLFIHIPFSSLFRDPTKFYLLTALSYSVMIPFGTYALLRWINIRFYSQRITLVLSSLPILFVLFLIRPALLGELNGTFKRSEIPKEYIDLKDFLVGQSNFSRTLWVPTQQRYNYYSYLHPAVSADNLFSATNSGELVKGLREEKASELLSSLSIQYIIVPYDSFGEIFVKDRRYDEKQYQDIVKVLDSLPWLQRLNGFGKIALYKTTAAMDHFWVDGEGSLSYTQLNSSTYRLDVSIPKASDVIFTEAYSPYWQADTGSETITSRKTANGTNSFSLKKAETHTLNIFFSKEKYYVYGRIISLLFIALIPIVLISSRKESDA